jgi:molecular chaperone GrpE (heat shock protein)
MTGPGGVDTETKRRIEQMRAAYDRLRTERIRAESEVERLRRELDEAREAARATFGTDNEEDIAVLIDAARAHNAKLVGEFEALLREIDSRLAAPEEER